MGSLIPLEAIIKIPLEAIIKTTAHDALVNAAKAWEAQPNGDTIDPGLWLRARAEGCTCNNPDACRECGAVLCSDCGVGDVSLCDHELGAVCVGCDVENCPLCRRAAGYERLLEEREP